MPKITLTKTGINKLPQPAKGSVRYDHEVRGLDCQVYAPGRRTYEFNHHGNPWVVICDAIHLA